MYTKILHLTEAENLTDIPIEVKTKIEEIAAGLDSYYGINRKEYEDGGYIIFVTNSDDLELVCELEIDVENCTAEYSEIIKTNTGAEYINTLFILNNEYAVTVIIPKEIAPPSLLEDCLI